MHIAVIGGGWAGLAAAVTLTASQHRITLFEAGRTLGGRARSVTVDGRIVDNGQHLLLGAYAETLALMRTVGADPDTLFERRPLAVLDDCGFELRQPNWPAPFNVAWGLLTARSVGPIEKLRTAIWMEGLKRQSFRLASDDTVANWLNAAGQTGQLRRHLWEPLCLAALNTPAERASAQLFANVLRDSLGSSAAGATDLLLPRVPLGDILPEPAALWLAIKGANLRLSHRVRRLESNNSGWVVDDTAFDAVVMAVAPQHAPGLWPALQPDYHFEPIATVYLQLDKAQQLDFPLRNTLKGIGQWVVDRGNGLLACVLSGHGDWEALPDDELAARLLAEIAPDKSSTWHKVIREKRATFSARPNLTRPDWRLAPGLVLAGDYTWQDYPATLEGAVRSGKRAALAAMSR